MGRLILALVLGVLAGVGTMVILAALLGEPIFPDALRDGLVAAIPAVLAVAGVAWWKGRRT